MYEFTKTKAGWRIHWGPPPRPERKAPAGRQVVGRNKAVADRPLQEAMLLVKRLGV